MALIKCSECGNAVSSRGIQFVLNGGCLLMIPLLLYKQLLIIQEIRFI